MGADLAMPARSDVYAGNPSSNQRLMLPAQIKFSSGKVGGGGTRTSEQAHHSLFDRCANAPARLPVNRQQLFLVLATSFLCRPNFFSADAPQPVALESQIETGNQSICMRACDHIVHSARTNRRRMTGWFGQVH